MSELRAVLFDVFGTLVDWRTSLIELAEGALPAGPDWPAVVDDWRRQYRPAMDRVRATGGWRNLDVVQAETLDMVLTSHRVDLAAADRGRLLRGWRQLRPWPDSRDGLAASRAGLVTGTLSNGHVALLVDLLRFGDLRVDAVLSAELAQSYKPDPQVYLHAVALLGCRPEQVAMVAAHADDVRAAAALGLRPVFVRRPTEWGPAGGDEPPSGLAGLVVLEDLRNLVPAVSGPPNPGSRRRIDDSRTG